VLISACIFEQRQSFDFSKEFGRQGVKASPALLKLFQMHMRDAELKNIGIVIQAS